LLKVKKNAATNLVIGFEHVDVGLEDAICRVVGKRLVHESQDEDEMGEEPKEVRKSPARRPCQYRAFLRVEQ
jgi:hypothetical protein